MSPGMQEWILGVIGGIAASLIYDIAKGNVVEWWGRRKEGRGRGRALYLSMLLDALVVAGFLGVVILLQAGVTTMDRLVLSEHSLAIAPFAIASSMSYFILKGIAAGLWRSA